MGHIHCRGHGGGRRYLNGDNPGDGLNFGHLFTDKANTPLLNQILLTAQRPLDPKATGYDFGFKLQVMYGSDARYVHYLGEADYWINELNQFTPVEAWAIDAYSLAVFGRHRHQGRSMCHLGRRRDDRPDHQLPLLAFLYLQFRHPVRAHRHHDDLACRSACRYLCRHHTGVNTTFGDRNVAHPSFHGGIGLNLLGGNLTILATTHIGAETPNTNGTNNTIDTIAACHCNPGDTLRFLNDITATWKINDSWTLITDANYIHDDGTYLNASGFGTFHPNGYGIAQYAIYTVNDWLKAVGRVEVWRDNNNFFVAAFPGNFDFVNAEHGFLNTSIPGGPAGGGTTYFEITGGLNIAPTIPQGTPLLKSITFRPEVRYDASLNNTTPFDGQNVFGGRGFPGFGVGTKS